VLLALGWRTGVHHEDWVNVEWMFTVQGSQNVPAISLATSGWAPSTNLSKIKIEVGKTEMLSRYLLYLLQPKINQPFSKYMYSEYFVNVIELIVILSIYFQTKVSCTSDMLVL
jgi:hypothetical protein